MKFFLYSLVGGLLMLAAVIGLYVATGARTFDFDRRWSPATSTRGLQKWLFLGFFIAFAIKAPLLPFHTWLPDAGAEAPVGGAALLVGVLDKVGTFGFLRYCLPLFPDASRYFAPMVLVLSVVGILYAALLAIGQNDLKRLVSYTSVAHFGFIGLGIFAFTTQALYRRGALHGQPRPRHRRAVPRRRHARRPRRQPAGRRLRRRREAGADPGRAVPARRAGLAGAAGHVDVRQRVPGADRHLHAAQGVRDHRDRRHHPGRALHPAAGTSAPCRAAATRRGDGRGFA